MSRLVASLLAVFAVCAVLSAQELPFAHYTPNDQVPLSSASVQKIIQDDQGYIWFAFYSSGLTRYDGHAMEEYGVADGLGDLTVREVGEDTTHHLWVGSESGLVVSEKSLDAYGPGQRVHFGSAVGNVALTKKRIRRNYLAIGPDGWVWVGTADGVERYRFHGATLERGTADPLRQPVSSVMAKRDGALLAALNDGTIAHIGTDGHLVEVLGAANGIPPIAVSTLMESRDGTLWGGCLNGLVWRLKHGAAQA